MKIKVYCVFFQNWINQTKKEHLKNNSIFWFHAQ